MKYVSICATIAPQISENKIIRVVFRDESEAVKGCYSSNKDKSLRNKQFIYIFYIFFIIN